MRVGLQIPYFKYDGGAAAIAPTLGKIARTAEDAGFYSLWVMDHFFQLEGMMGPADDPMLEGYSTLAYLAAQTQRVKLGTLVTGAIYRHPSLLIKTVTTLDVLSGGRAYMGIGAAWYEKETVGLGMPFPPLKERFERLEDALRLAHHMWRGDRSPFDGTHVHAAEPISSPQPLSQPHPPIMIGGGGGQKTLRLVGPYAETTQLFSIAGPGALRHKLDVLRGHCDALGRDYDSIEKTALGSIHLASGQMTAEAVLSLCRQLAEVGFSHVIFNMPNMHDLTPLEVMGRDVIPALAGL